MLRIQNRVRNNEDGAVAVMVGIFLLTLMVFAAWAVDISAVLVERRADQAAADVGALSGAQFTAYLTPAAGQAAAEAEVRRISAVNIGTTSAQWNSCVDTSRPARFTVVAPTTDCVSFTIGMAEMRVRVPDQDVPTLFAGVIGINSIATRADAEVTVSSGDTGGVLPFGLPPSAGGPEVCLKSGTSPLSVPPCDGPATGNFGFLDFKLYTGTAPNSCSSGFLEENMASGVDHFLEVGITTFGDIHEFDYCGNINARPDRTKSQTGGTNTVHIGMVTSNAPTARLQRGTNPKLSVMGEDLDNRPLWDYMTAGNGLCTQGTISTAAIPHEAMAACLGSGAANTVRFSDTIIDSPRWAFVPTVHQDFSTGGSADYVFTSFVPVFIQTIFGNCTASSCDEFNPAEGNTIPNNKKANAMSAFLIPSTSVSPAVLVTFPGTEQSIDYLLTR